MVREKLHRLARSCYQGEVTIAFTVGVANRTRLFTTPGTVGVFVELLARAAERHGCIVPAYCFMPDHLHLVLHGANPAADLWRAAVEFKQSSGYWLSKHLPGITWQKDFHDHVFRSDEDLGTHVRYVLGNPCRSGLITDWSEYPYSGAIGCSLEDVLTELPL